MSENGMDRPCSRQTREHTCGGAIVLWLEGGYARPAVELGTRQM